jgi:hypothetical protein
MENNKTAVEWLEENLIGNPHFESDFIHNRNVFNQAKQMEKEQIKKAYKIGVAWGHNNMEEYYYSETYNKKDDA